MDNIPGFPISFEQLYQYNKPRKVMYKHIEKDMESRRSLRYKTNKEYRKQKRLSEANKRRGIDQYEYSERLDTNDD